MKSFLACAIAAAALVSGAPALAQPYGPPPGPHGPGMMGPGAPAPGGWDLHRRIDWMQHRIDRGRQDGSLDRREAFRVQRELQRIRMDEDRMRDRHGGRLWDRDRMYLQQRLDRLNDQIRWLRHNDERRPW